ncbi:hypothetical protein KCP73_02745 [Salmonella enterica subsp. enterica]|nr:hypothetical protein KCP73_02745 [Salmonella enterica subsp. enterica]
MCNVNVRPHTSAGNGCSYAQNAAKTAETSDPARSAVIARLCAFVCPAVKAREYGIINHDVDNFAPRCLFSTLTNRHPDSRIVGYAREAIALRGAAESAVLRSVMPMRIATTDGRSAPPARFSDLQRHQARIYPNKDKAAIGENIRPASAVLYGLKGAAAVSRTLPVNTTTTFHAQCT